MRFFLLPAALLGLAACVGATDTGAPVDVGDGVRLVPEREWAQFDLGYGRIWTREGVGLDEIHFYMGIKNGQPLLTAPGVAKASLPPYDARMLPNDVEDLLTASLAKKKYQGVKADHLAPCSFGPLTGFCFDLSFTDENGLEMLGKVRALKQEDRLELLLFQAPREYYYPLLSPSVDKLFSSVQLVPQKSLPGRAS